MSLRRHRLTPINKKLMTCEILQQYWWAVVSLLGGLLAFLMFVQGAQTMIFHLGRTEEERRLLVNSAGRKWEFTFTTLVTFGGAFFAGFPLFYSTSFGGAYWAWMLLLVSFVLQAVAYEFQSKSGNVLGRNAYRAFLVFNGVAGPFLVGVVVSSLFTGSAFVVDRGAVAATGASVVISRWANAWHGLDLLFSPANLCLGAAVALLARQLGALYLLSNLRNEDIALRLRRQMRREAPMFILCFVGWTLGLLYSDGAAVDRATGLVYLRPTHYWLNFLAHPSVLALFVSGVVLVLAGLASGAVSRKCRHGIWGAGAGTVMAVMALFLVAGLGDSAYYPSTADLQSSLTLTNSASSPFTLRVMAFVSLLVPFVLAYIVWAWRAIDRGGLSTGQLDETEHKY